MGSTIRFVEFCLNSFISPERSDSPKPRRIAKRSAWYSKERERRSSQIWKSELIGSKKEKKSAEPIKMDFSWNPKLRKIWSEFRKNPKM